MIGFSVHKNQQYPGLSLDNVRLEWLFFQKIFSEDLGDLAQDAVESLDWPLHGSLTTSFGVVLLPRSNPSIYRGMFWGRGTGDCNRWTLWCSFTPVWFCIWTGEVFKTFGDCKVFSPSPGRIWQWTPASGPPFSTINLSHRGGGGWEEEEVWFSLDSLNTNQSQDLEILYCCILAFCQTAVWLRVRFQPWQSFFRSWLHQKKIQIWAHLGFSLVLMHNEILSIVSGKQLKKIRY